MFEINSWDAASASIKLIGIILSSLKSSFCNIPHITCEGELGVEPGSGVVLVAKLPLGAHSFIHVGLRRSLHCFLDGFGAKATDPFAGIRVLNLGDVCFGALLCQTTAFAFCFLQYYYSYFIIIFAFNGLLQR